MAPISTRLYVDETCQCIPEIEYTRANQENSALITLACQPDPGGTIGVNDRIVRHSHQTMAVPPSRDVKHLAGELTSMDVVENEKTVQFVAISR